MTLTATVSRRATSFRENYSVGNSFVFPPKTQKREKKSDRFDKLPDPYLYNLGEGLLSGNAVCPVRTYMQLVLQATN